MWVQILAKELIILLFLDWIPPLHSSSTVRRWSLYLHPILILKLKFLAKSKQRSAMYWSISWVLSGGYFFILQSLTTLKMRKKQIKKLDGLKTHGLVGLWATLEGRFFIFWAAKYCIVRTEKLHKMKLKKSYIYIFLIWLSNLNWNCHHDIFTTNHFSGYIWVPREKYLKISSQWNNMTYIDILLVHSSL